MMATLATIKCSRFRLACYILCLVGCLYQLVSISIVFWNFDSYLIREIETPDTFPLPGVTLCFDKSILLVRRRAQEYLEKAQMEMLRVFDHRVFQTMAREERLFQLMSFLTISLQHQITKSVREMKFNCFLESIGLIECDNIFTITPYLTLAEKCFDFKPKPGHHNFVRQIVPRRGQLRIIFNKPDSAAGSHLKVSIHSPPAGIKFWGSNWYSINYDFHDSVDLTYTITQKHYLPYPYKTNCSFHASNDCIYTCLYNYFPNRTNRWLPTVPGFEDNHYLFEFHDAIDNEKLGTISVIKDCERSCDRSLACEVEEYHILMLSQNVERFKSYFQISITPPSHISVEHLKPKISIVEFICYIGSTTGLWLGLSLYHIVANFDLRKFVHGNPPPLLNRHNQLPTNRNKEKRQSLLADHA